MRTGEDWRELGRVCGSPKFGAAVEDGTCDRPNRKKEQLEWVRGSFEEGSTEAGRSHGVLCSQPLSVRNQQIGPDPERPAWVHEMEPERIHPAVYLVSESAPKRRRILHICGGNADLSRWAAQVSDPDRPETRTHTL